MSTLLLTVALIPLGAADDHSPWMPAGRIVMPNEKPFTTASCPVIWLDQICGSSKADFGSAVATDSNVVVVGEPHERSVHFYEQSDSLWLPVVSFDGPEGFGESVAIRGDTAAAAAPDDAVVHVFQRTETGWEQVADISFGAGCPGEALALEATLLIIGDPCSSTISVFNGHSSDWSLTAILSVPGAPGLGARLDVADSFIVAVSSEGVHAFELSQDGWIQEWVKQGTSWSVATNGRVVMIGNGEEVEVHSRHQGSWALVQILFPEDPSWFEGYSSFGRPLAMVGSTLVAGAVGDHSLPSDPSNGDESDDACVHEFGFGTCIPPRPGAAYVFEEGEGGWSQVAKLIGNPVGDYRFGEAVSISHDGERVAVGAPRNLLRGFGSVYGLDPEDSVHLFSQGLTEVTDVG